MVQTEAKGETGATMERTGEEEGILPERSEWFRSRGIIGTARLMMSWQEEKGIFLSYETISKVQSFLFTTLTPWRAIGVVGCEGVYGK